MNIPSQFIMLAISLFMLALEKFGVPIPPWLTGTVLMVTALMMLIGGG